MLKHENENMLQNKCKNLFIPWYLIKWVNHIRAWLVQEKTCISIKNHKSCRVCFINHPHLYAISKRIETKYYTNIIKNKNKIKKLNTISRKHYRKNQVIQPWDHIQYMSIALFTKKHFGIRVHSLVASTGSVPPLSLFQNVLNSSQNHNTCFILAILKLQNSFTLCQRQKFILQRNPRCFSQLAKSLWWRIICMTDPANVTNITTIQHMKKEYNIWKKNKT